MANDLPRTTVMMAAYESHATVRESVESVLAQTVPELELIVVDDGSQVRSRMRSAASATSACT